MAIFLVIVHLIAVMCDIVMFLLLIRLTCRWRPVGVLQEFDVAGAPLLARLCRHVRRIWRHLTGSKPLGPLGELGLALVLVSVIRLMTHWATAP